MGLTKYIFVLFCSLGSLQFFAQEVTASVSKNPVREDEKFHFTITLVNVDGNIAMPDLKEFNIMGGPNQTSRIQNINGVRTQSYKLSWVLNPKRQGEFTIKPIETKGSLTYDPITVEVTAGFRRTEDPIEAQKNETKDHFGRIYLSNNNPYKGEQIIATYVIYTRVPGFNPNYDFANTIEGFWTEELDVQPQWSNDLEQFNGVNYKKAIIRKQILFPQKTGELKLEPFTVEGRLRVGWGRYQNVNFKSNTAVVNVKKLPAGAPDNYKGAVGAYDFAFEVDKTEVDKDEAFNVSVTISGKGNLSLVNELPVNFPNDFEVYDPEIKDKIGKNSSGMSGSRKFDYLIVPRHSGNYEIDGISFSYFNPKSNRYVTESADDLIINVKKSANDINTEGPSIVRKEDVAILENDIRFISLNSNLEDKGSFFFGSLPYTTGVFAPALGFLAFMFVRRRRLNEMADVVGSKKKKAGKVAAKRLAAARKALETGNVSEFYSELHLALSKYLGDKVNMANSEFTKESVENELKRNKASDATIQKFLDVLGNCEMARYAPSASADPKVMMLKGEEIINALEEELL